MLVVLDEESVKSLNPEAVHSEEDIRRVFLSREFLREFLGNLHCGDKDRKAVFIAKDYNTPHGSIDVLVVDNQGEIYIIETKLHRNSERRKIVAQVLDYAAGLWSQGREDPQRLIGEINGADEELVMKTMRKLVAGDYHLVLVMDQLDTKLGNVISYLQRRGLKIYAVQLKLYTLEKRSIAELSISNPNCDTLGGKSPAHLTLAEKYQQIGDEKLRQRLLDLLEWAAENRVLLNPRGQQPVLGIARRNGDRLVSIYPDGRMYIYIGPKTRHSQALREALTRDLAAIDLINPEEINNYEYAVPAKRNIAELTDKEFKALLEILKKYATS